MQMQMLAGAVRLSEAAPAYEPKVAKTLERLAVQLMWRAVEAERIEAKGAARPPVGMSAGDARWTPPPAGAGARRGAAPVRRAR